MKERSQNLTDQKERDNATLNFVNYQAQEAILDPNLPDSLKDEFLDIAIQTIRKIGERRASYHTKYGEGGVLDGQNSMKEGEIKPPTLFDEINSYLRREAPEDIENPTVQGIAQRLGIPGDVLNHWLNNDRQFREEMERLKEFQTKDPFNEGTEFDYFVHSSGVQFILDETKKRYSI